MFVSQRMPGYAIAISPEFFRSPTWKRTGSTVSVPLRSTRCTFHASVSKLEQPSTDTKTRQEEEDEINASVASSVLDGKRGGNKDGVHVPRQKYIPIPKSELLDAILLMFETSKERQDFLIMSSCLDSILHAEHKTMLEEMRVDYDLTHSTAKQTNIQGHASLDKNIMPNGKVSGSADDKFKDFGNKPKSSSSVDDLLGISTNNPKMNSLEMSRVPVDSRFQRAFVQLLFNAQFEELSATDLMLTSALNTNYLLTLPIYVDWQRAFESKAIIFRRGYATERQRGLLIGEKLDYLQSKLLQGFFFTTSKPLGKLRTWFAEAIKNNIQEQDIESWKKIIELRFKELSLFQKSFLNEENIPDSMMGVDQLSDKDLPLWLAAQRAVMRYEGILSALGPRGRLLRKLFTWTGLMPSMPEELEDLHSANAASEPYLRPIFLSRISLCDIWEPASSKCCGNDPWKMLKTAVFILFSQSVLQEPAFEELILLYTEMVDEKESVEKAEVPMLQLKIYQRIPIPDLPVIFPHKKLSFRILDTVRLDVATIVGLLAYFINYKFENILSSPSAILLDVIAVSALVIYVTRIALGYKQTWDRYQLLVNRTLYEKTVASGFGSVHFLLDASEQQQYKEAILAYAILLKSGTTQVTCARIAGDKCERFIYDVFRKKVEMPIDKAINSLLRLGLVMEKEVGGKVGLQAIPCPVAHEILKERWSSLLI